MLPILQKNGILIAIVALCLLITGVIFQNIPILLAGQLVIIAMFLSILRFGAPIALLDRRAIKMDIANSDSIEENIHTTLSTHTYIIRIINQYDIDIPRLYLTPYTTGSLSCHIESPKERFLSIHPNNASYISISCEAALTGRFALQGFDIGLQDRYALVEWKDFIPCLLVYQSAPAELPIRLLKRIKERGQVNNTGMRGATELHNEGDFHQLRPYRWGESIRNVAWKSSLRKGQLLSREYEEEKNRHILLILDTFSTMRGGIPVGEKLEFALKMTLGLLTSNERANLPTDLLIFSEGSTKKIVRAERRIERKHVLNAMALIRSPMIPEEIELTESEVISTASEYLRLVERLDFRTYNKETHLIDDERVARLNKWLSYQKEVELFQEISGIEKTATDSKIGSIISYLQSRGVALPYRSETRLGLKEEKLEKILRDVTRGYHHYSKIEIVSDLCGILSVLQLSKGITRCRRMGIEVEIIQIPTRKFHDANEGTLYEAIKELFGEVEEEKLSTWIKKLM